MSLCLGAQAVWVGTRFVASVEGVCIFFVLFVRKFLLFFYHLDFYFILNIYFF